MYLCNGENICIDRQTDGRADGGTDGRTGGWRDRRTDGQAGKREAGRQAGRQTDRFVMESKLINTSINLDEAEKNNGCQFKTSAYRRRCLSLYCTVHVT